jgi:DNA polymerase III epsilon subunit-like protein
VRHALTADGLIAHNAHVDVGVLERKLSEWEHPEIFDTLKLARRLVPNGPPVVSVDSVVMIVRVGVGRARLG